MKASRFQGPKSNDWSPSGRRGDTGSWEKPPAELGGRLQQMYLQELWFGASGPLNCERIVSVGCSPQCVVLSCAAPGNSVVWPQEDPEEAHGPSKHWGGEKESDWGSVPRLELTDGGILVFFTLRGATAGPSGIGSWGWGGWRAPLCPGGVRCSLDPPAGSKRCQEPSASCSCRLAH